MTAKAAKPISTRHRWGDRVEVSQYKSEKQCSRCGVVRASMHQFDGARDLHWKEFYLDLERVDAGDGATPPCDARLERELADNLEVMA